MKMMVERESDSGKKRGGRAGKTKATWKGKPTNILKRKTPVEIMQRLRTSRMDTRLRTPAPRRKRVGGWEKKNNRGLENNFIESELRIELKYEEARVNLTRNAPDEKS